MCIRDSVEGHYGHHSIGTDGSRIRGTEVGGTDKRIHIVRRMLLRSHRSVSYTHLGAFIDDGFLIDYLTPEEYFYFIGKMYGLKKEEVDERLLPFERFMNGEVMRCVEETGASVSGE